MELRSRKSHKPKPPAPAPAPTPTPVATPLVSQPRNRASLGRSATEPLADHHDGHQQTVIVEVKKEISLPRPAQVEAVRTNILVVPAFRAQSTPATLAPQDQAFNILEKHIGNRLSTEDFATYRTLIADRVMLIVDDSSRRERSRRLLRDFLDKHPGVLHIHNKFARSYNRTKNEEFHVPEFGRLPGIQWQGTSAALHTAPVEETPKVHEMRNSSIVTPIVELVMKMSKAEDGQGGNSGHPAVGSSTGNENASPEILHVRPTIEMSRGVAQDRQGVEQPLLGKKGAASRFSTIGSPSGHEIVQKRGWEEERSPVSVPIAISRESEQAQGLRVSANGQAARPGSAQSYLAWLQHRQARYPKARPNSSECLLVAKKLGRSSATVYEDVLHHWSLETDSRHGEWYRQNRLQILGENPRFEVDNMSIWEAWLKQGRDEMEKKDSAIEVVGGVKE